MVVADGDYYTGANVKVLLNIPVANTNSDAKVEVFGDEADNYVNSQISVHESSVPIVITAKPELELGNLTDSLAASTFNYWQSPAKDRTLEHIEKWEHRIQDHIKAIYANMSASGITENTITKTASKITGTE